MTVRPIISVTTGKPSKSGQRLRSKDGLTWKQRNREAVNRRRRELYALNPDKERKRTAKYRAENYQSVLAANRAYGVKWRARMREEMIAAYGGQCACCGESEPAFLQLDHTNNDGAASRRRENANGAEYWLRLKRRGWPTDGYQLLCANCNWGRYINGGTCPHAHCQ